MFKRLFCRHPEVVETLRLDETDKYTVVLVQCKVCHRQMFVRILK